LKLYVYIIRRLLLMIPVLLGVVAITFALSHVNINLLISEYEGRIHTPQARQAVINALHLNGNFLEQYLYYVVAVFTGNWGYTAPSDIDPGSPVVLEFMRRFPPTAELAIVATLIMVALSLPLGILSAVKKDRLVDQATRLIAMFFYSIPVFWFGLIIILIIGPGSKIVPPWLQDSGTGQLNFQQYAIIYKNGVYTLAPWAVQGGLSRPTGFLVIDTALYGDWPAFLDALKHLMYPSIVVGVTSFGVFVRYLRSSMLETLGQDFIRTAKSKGVPERYVIKKHARRNSLGPTTTIMGLTIAGLLAGVVVTENIFGWPGMGTWLYDAAVSDDLVSIIATTFVFTIVIVIANLIVDILYAYLDPRVRLE